MPTSDRIPLFPLDLVLLPHEVLPLHIFEHRYRMMIRRCLSEDAPFGVVATDQGEAEQVGCTARIRQVVREFDDGTFDIETIGERRFRVEASHDDQPFTTADIVYLPDTEGAGESPEKERLIAQHMKLLELLGETIRPNLYEDSDALSFRIGARCGLELPQRLELLQLDAESDRIAFLVTHLQDFIPRVRSARERQDRVRSNGHFH